MHITQPLWRLSILTALEAEDAVAELAGSLLGQPAAAYFDLEQRISRVSVYRERKIPAAILQALADGLQKIKSAGLETGSGRISVERVKREDWAESWKKHFQPLSIGEALLIKPSWSRRRAVRNQAVVVLDPGLSFGTGQHPTTAFCLEQLVRNRDQAQPRSFLDIGTGSGILAIAAAKLGYQPVHAFDFDPACVRIARENARENGVAGGVAGAIKITRGDVVRLKLKPSKKFDLVCANLISNLLVAERRKIVAQLHPAGTLVLAGILRGEFSAVEQAFAQLGWHFSRGKSVKEWRSGAFRRRS